MTVIDLNELVDIVSRTGDFEEYKRTMSEAFIRDPILVSKESLNESSKLLPGFVAALRKSSFTSQPLFRLAFPRMLKIVFDPAARNLRVFLPFLEVVKKDTVFDLESARAALNGGPLYPPRDFGKIRPWLKVFHSELESYQRAVRRFVGYARIAQGETTSVAELRKVRIRDLEKELEGRIGPGLLLGDEYRHIRNSLAHDTYNVREARREVEFVDVDPSKGEEWRKTYPYADLAASYELLAIWLAAARLAIGAESVVVWGVVLRLVDPSERARPPEETWGSLTVLGEVNL